MKTIQRPQPELAKEIGIADLWFKREDTHAYGSHKGRSIPLMIKEYAKREGTTHFVVSSSGNAALAAILTIVKYNQNNATAPLFLSIYIGKKIPTEKKEALEQANTDPKHITITQVDRPKQTAFQEEKKDNTTWLRQSTDDSALRGYLDLAKELSKIPDLEAVFIPTSSGTTAQGIAEGFKSIGMNIQIHVVQTTNCCPIASTFDTNFDQTDTCCAKAIVDIVAHRKPIVVDLIQESHGSGWVVNDEQIHRAQSITKKTTGLDVSTNSALSIAGIQKAIEAGWTWNGAVVAVITGL